MIEHARYQFVLLVLRCRQKTKTPLLSCDNNGVSKAVGGGVEPPRGS